MKAAPFNLYIELFAGELRNDMNAYLRDVHNRHVSPHMTPRMIIGELLIRFLERPAE